LFFFEQFLGNSLAFATKLTTNILKGGPKEESRKGENVEKQGNNKISNGRIHTSISLACASLPGSKKCIMCGASRNRDSGTGLHPFKPGRSPTGLNSPCLHRFALTADEGQETIAPYVMAI
jgi:hypothetical protein